MQKHVDSVNGNPYSGIFYVVSDKIFSSGLGIFFRYIGWDFASKFWGTKQ